MRKVVLLAAALVVALGVTASSATSAASETGVTARTVTIGGTFPLTGPASLYATIPPAMKAYFSYINSRKGPDGKRGVYGRQIVFKYYDDGYNPANSVQLTRKLVEEDKVFAVVGSLGTAVNEGIRPYLNARKVPQILNSTGASVFAEAKSTRGRAAGSPRTTTSRGSTARRSPTTARTRRSRSSTRTTTSARRTSTGSRRGSARRHRTSSRAESYEVTAADVRAQIAKLRASGASIFVIFATPKFTIQSYAIANALRWSPAVIYTTSVVGDRRVPDAREELGRRRPARPDVHGAVREGSGEPGLGQRRGDEALQAGDGQVLPERSGHRRAELLRRGGRGGVRRAPVHRREEPDAGVADEGATAAGTSRTRSCSRATGRRPAGPTSFRSSASGSSSSRTARSSPVSKLKCDTAKAT